MNGAPWEVAYRDHVAQQEDNLLRYLTIHRTCGCPQNIHAAARTAFACGHVIQQDEIHPNGIVRMPKGYFLCKKCKSLLDRCKLKFVYEIATTCSECVWMEISRIIALNPEHFVDLKPRGAAEDQAPVKA